MCDDIGYYSYELFFDSWYYVNNYEDFDILYLRLFFISVQFRIPSTSTVR